LKISCFNRAKHGSERRDLIDYVLTHPRPLPINYLSNLSREVPTWWSGTAENSNPLVTVGVRGLTDEYLADGPEIS